MGELKVEGRERRSSKSSYGVSSRLWLTCEWEGSELQHGRQKEGERERGRAGLGRKVATRKKKYNTFFRKEKKKEEIVALRCGRSRSRSRRNTSDNPLVARLETRVG